jgi:hypothetical protein
VTYVVAKARIVGERKLKETKVKGAKAKGRLVVILVVVFALPRVSARRISQGERID